MKAPSGAIADVYHQRICCYFSNLLFASAATSCSFHGTRLLHRNRANELTQNCVSARWTKAVGAEKRRSLKIFQEDPAGGVSSVCMRSPAVDKVVFLLIVSIGCNCHSSAKGAFFTVSTDSLLYQSQSIGDICCVPRPKFSEHI